MADHFASGETLQSKEAVSSISRKYCLWLRNYATSLHNHQEAQTTQFMKKQGLRNKAESNDVIKIDGANFRRGFVSHG
jgi:hypothetical protein